MGSEKTDSGFIVTGRFSIHRVNANDFLPKWGIWHFPAHLRKPKPDFLFTFSMIFAFAVGLSTGNFGTLSRYKIPCMPFFAALLIILYFSKQKRLKQRHGDSFSLI
jgi:hypothetical protein